MLRFSVESREWQLDVTSWMLVDFSDCYVRNQLTAYGGEVRINPIYEALSVAFELMVVITERDEAYEKQIESILRRGKECQKDSRFDHKEFEARLFWTLEYLNSQIENHLLSDFQELVARETSRFAAMLHWRTLASKERVESVNTDIEIVSGTTVLKGSSSQSSASSEAPSAADVSKLYHSEMFKLASDFRICRENKTLPWWGCALIFLLSLLGSLIRRFAEITKVVSITRQ